MTLAHAEAERNIKTATAEICKPSKDRLQKPVRTIYKALDGEKTVQGFCLSAIKAYFCLPKNVNVCLMDKLFRSLIAATSLLILGSCQSIQQLSIDYRVPAEINFPENMRRVAVVNNMPQNPAPFFPPENSHRGDGEEEVSVTHKTHIGDARIASMALAQGLADENYFDEVIICDSALRANDKYPRSTTLSQAEVHKLIRQLDVDFIIALEDVQMTSRRQAGFVPYYDAYVGMLDVKVHSKASLYFPSRQTAAATISCTDSIYWEEEANSLAMLNARLINEGDMVLEASGFAGALPVKRLLPSWHTATRYYFTGGSVYMRDASIYIKEDNWPEAIRLWKQAYELSKREKQKMYAAYNTALGYEMQDSISTALCWAIKAQESAAKVDKIEKLTSPQQPKSIRPEEVPNYLMATLYVNELKKRNDNMQQLDLQMNRFEKP